MNVSSKPAWFRLVLDVSVVLAVLLAAIYVITVEARAFEEPASVSLLGDPTALPDDPFAFDGQSVSPTTRPAVPALPRLG